MTYANLSKTFEKFASRGKDLRAKKAKKRLK
jgi:hypothetical protein